jgi:hypothetical protein
MHASRFTTALLGRGLGEAIQKLGTSLDRAKQGLSLCAGLDDGNLGGNDDDYVIDQVLVDREISQGLGGRERQVQRAAPVCWRALAPLACRWLGARATISRVVWASAWSGMKRARELPPNVTALRENSPAVRHLLTKMRDRTTPCRDFVHCADRVHRLLAEEALALLKTEPKEVITPLGVAYQGLSLKDSNFSVVSIIRAGDALQDAVSRICPEAPVGEPYILDLGLAGIS